MTFTTTTQSLVGPSGGDSIQAAGDAVKDLAFRTDARLDAQDANLAVSQVPPFTVVESKLLVNFDRVAVGWTFDTVLVDTQQGANLDEDPRRINLRRTGYWMLGGYAAGLAAPGALLTTFVLNINVNSNAPGLQFEDVQDGMADGGFGLQASCSTIAQVTDATTAYSYMFATVPGTFTSGFPNTVPITYRRMWAYWLRDL